MPPVAAGPHGGGGQTLFDKLKMGAMMGGSVGLIIGFIFGATNIIRFGPGPNGMMRTLGQYMAGSSATFGFFMSIGTAIRTESPIAAQARFARTQGPLVIQSREFARRQRQDKPVAN